MSNESENEDTSTTTIKVTTISDEESWDVDDIVRMNIEDNPGDVKTQPELPERWVDQSTTTHVIIATATPESRGFPQTLGGILYGAMLNYNGILTDSHQEISSIPWSWRIAVMEEAEKDFKKFRLYAWDGQFYWGVETKALSLWVWKKKVAIDDADL